MQSPPKDRAMSASPLKSKDAKVEPVDMKLEVVVIGVSDVDVRRRSTKSSAGESTPTSRRTISALCN